MQTQQMLISTMLIAGLMFFNNCGSSKTGGSTDQASRSVPTDQPGDTSGGGWLSNCNVIPNNNLDLAGPVSTYYDQASGSYIEDLIRLKFNNYPVELISEDNIYIQIFPWQEDSPGNPVYRQTAVDIYFILKNSGAQLQTEPVNELSKGTIQSLIQNNNMNVSPDQFFSSVIMVLDGVDLTWDAITIAIYDTPGGTATDYVNILLPAFDADPNIYAIDHPATSLRQLHPWWHIKDDNYSEADFFNFSKDLCNGF